MFNGISVSQNMIRVDVNVIHGPDLTYPSRDRGRQAPLEERERDNGSWNLATRRFVTPASQGSWSVLQIEEDRQGNVDLTPFFNLVTEQLPLYGITSTRVRQQRQEVHRISRHGAMQPHQLRNKLLEIFQGAVAGSVRVAFVIMPRKETQLYQALKCTADLAGIHTICHVANRGQPVSNWNNIGNMLMKFNLKMHHQSVNQTIRGVQTNSIPYLDRDTMLMGIDVTHAPTTALTGAPSIAAVVGSVNDDFSQFPAEFSENVRVADQSGRLVPNEEVVDLHNMVNKSIRKWKSTHQGNMPRKIIVFRDGLSEEQLLMCQSREIPKMRSGIQMAKTHQNDPTPLLVVICTVKRHNVRFYQEGLNSRGHFRENPVPGSMIHRRVVLEPNRHEFFMISHSPLQGTARPVHYIPLETDVTLTTNDLARMVSLLITILTSPTLI